MPVKISFNRKDHPKDIDNTKINPKFVICVHVYFLKQKQFIVKLIYIKYNVNMAKLRTSDFSEVDFIFVVMDRQCLPVNIDASFERSLTLLYLNCMDRLFKFSLPQNLQPLLSSTFNRVYLYIKSNKTFKLNILEN